MGKAFLQQLRNEFRGYNGHKLSQDLMAGLTVAAVALPLALAFGVSAGATAACGLVTAIVAGPEATIRYPVRPERWRRFSAR